MLKYLVVSNNTPLVILDSSTDSGITIDKIVEACGLNSVGEPILLVLSTTGELIT